MLAAPAIPWGAAKREQLRVAGFVELPRAISPGGLRQLNAAVDEHLAAGAPPMVTAPWLFPGSVVGEALWRLASEPAVVGLARELCGPNVLLWAGGLVVKMPHGEGEPEEDPGGQGLIPWQCVAHPQADPTSHPTPPTPATSAPTSCCPNQRALGAPTPHYINPRR